MLTVNALAVRKRWLTQFVKNWNQEMLAHLEKLEQKNNVQRPIWPMPIFLFQSLRSDKTWDPQCEQPPDWQSKSATDSISHMGNRHIWMGGGVLKRWNIWWWKHYEVAFVTEEIDFYHLAWLPLHPIHSEAGLRPCFVWYPVIQDCAMGTVSYHR